MVCAPVRSIIPSLKLGDYLSVQAHNPCSISHKEWINRFFSALNCTDVICSPFYSPCYCNVVYIPIITLDVNGVRINMSLYSRVGRRRCSAISRRTACKCFTASILAFI